MKKLILCECGSGKAKDDCCASKVRIFKQPIANPSEHQAFLFKLEISSQFNLRYRGLFEFYGDDMVAYKLKNPTSETRNQFLHVLGRYFTEYLEDDCPSSWKDCDPSFWEEFIFSFYPFLMQVTPNQDDVNNFLSELSKFSQWIDQRVGSTSFRIIEPYMQEAKTCLKECEFVFRHLYLYSFPHILDKNWDPLKDYLENARKIDDSDEVNISIYEVENINGSIVTATAFDLNRSFLIKGMPNDVLSPGMILSGIICRNNGDWVWNWEQPESVFPKRAKKYLKNVKLGPTVF